MMSRDTTTSRTPVSVPPVYIKSAPSSALTSEDRHAVKKLNRTMGEQYEWFYTRFKERTAQMRSHNPVVEMVFDARGLKERLSDALDLYVPYMLERYSEQSADSSEKAVGGGKANKSELAKAVGDHAYKPAQTVSGSTSLNRYPRAVVRDFIGELRVSRTP